MDTVKFIEERNRMCKSYSDCKGCPAFDDREYKTNCEVSAASTLDAKLQVDIVEKWSVEHPKKQKKTRQDVFLEQYPESHIDDHGILYVCPASISHLHRNDEGKCSCSYESCVDCRLEFWMQEVE